MQNLSIRFKLLVNDLRYAIHSKPSESPLERRAGLQVEEEDNISRYLLNLKRKIGLQVRLLNPMILGEALNFASEIEMSMKESHQSTKQQMLTPRPPIEFINKPTPPPRTLANTTPQKAYNQSMPLVYRSQIKCHKCGKLGHSAAQCFTNTQNFQKGTSQKRPPEIRTTRGSEAMEKLFRQTRNDTRGNNRTNKLRGDSRIFSLSGRLQSIHGRKPDGSIYRLLVDSGAAINIIKKDFLKKDFKKFQFIKNFAMGDLKKPNYRSHVLSYFGKNHLFHIVEREFPLPEDGIIGLPFFRKFPRYAIT